jgi:hypothetical protein
MVMDIDYKEILKNADVSFKNKETNKTEEVDPAQILMEQNFQLYRLMQQIQNQGAIQLAMITMIAEKCGVDVDKLAKDLKKKMDDNKKIDSKELEKQAWNQPA